MYFKTFLCLAIAGCFPASYCCEQSKVAEKYKLLRSYIGRNGRDDLNRSLFLSMLLSVSFRIGIHYYATQQGLLDHAVGYIITRRVVAVNTIVGKMSRIQNKAYLILSIVLTLFLTAIVCYGFDANSHLYTCFNSQRKKIWLL